MELGHFRDRINFAPPIPLTQIEFRRWWNQIIIEALSTGTMSGCFNVRSKINCSYAVINNGSKQLPCTRCSLVQAMEYYPESAFIGFRL
jgi:hypothetical protein